jgi:CzcA family heavy metal efflux pump
MLQAIVHWSLHNRVAVLALTVLLLLTGIYAATHARLDVFPEFAPPQVIIQTEAPGFSPGEVEQLVTLPIEYAVNGIPHLDVLRSQSLQGLSVITIIFQDGTDIYRARQQVTERLAELAGQFPAGVKAPRLAPLTATTGRLVSVGFTSRQLTPLELRDLVQWTVRPRLLGVRGVAQVTLYGGDVRQYQVQIVPDWLEARKLTVTDVVDAARQASGIRGAGFLENSNQRITLRVEGQVKSAAELGETVVATSEGTPVCLKDVARVVEAAEPKFGDAAIEGKPGVILIAYKQLDGDTLEVTQRVEEELEKLEPLLQRQAQQLLRDRKAPVPPGGSIITYHRALFRQANFIEFAISNVSHSLILGAILVSIVLFVFLFNLRTAFISLTAIPLSLVTAIVVLWAWGVGLNTLTLGGLAIAVGEVVDDAIIDVENIFRRLRENHRLGHPRSAIAVVLSASLEVRSAVVYATFVVVLVFVPVFFLSGLQGRLFAPLGYAYVLAVLASLAVALTVTPALSLVLLPHAEGAEEPPLLRRLQGSYEWLLRRLDTQLPLVVAVATTLVGGAVAALFFFGGEFLPELRENHFVVHMRGLPGTSLPQSLTTGKQVTAKLRENPAVLSVAQQVGRAELGEDTWGVEYSELEVDLKRLAAEDAAKVQRNIGEVLGQNFPGFNFEAMPFLSERIKETLSGSSAAVAVKVFGDRLEDLDRAALQIVQVLASIKGSDNVRAEAQTGAPELVVRVRREEANRRGLRNVHILEALHNAYQGAEIGQVYQGNRVIDIMVILDPRSRANVETIANLWLNVPNAAREGETPVEPVLKGPAGTFSLRPGTSRLQLKQVADVYLSDGRFLISHEGVTRRQVVTCNVKKDERDVESFVAEAERKLRQLRLPAGVYYELAGEHEARRTAQRELLLLGLAAGAGIVLLLWTVFRSVRLLILVLVNLPFALVGGVAAVYLTGGLLDVGSLIGFVTLFGITTRNSIMMISHWQHLHEVENLEWGPELVFRGARERLAPVLMTALVTALGLLPIALGSGEAGREIEGPMALVILGGLVTSTTLNLFVLPVLYRRFGKTAAAQPRTA